MRAYGYARGRPDDDDEEPVLLELSEVTFVGTPDALREVAEFLIAASQDLEKYGQDFGHVHLQHKNPRWRSMMPQFVDVIVARGS
ncbi:MAG: hypothetical protein DWI21_13615 [Planctomycetota bacterium]|nr:MAG: hypothetical protein DWI21_13615 [Planctomycetota bacterium]GDY10224.1 hypothetical protein LBMAG52_37120 [Planctomycetia bacterium]